MVVITGSIMSRLAKFIPAGVFALALGGCATLTDSTQQQLELHAILDNREVWDVGCVLSNDAGRWYVIAPGRVTVTRSAGPLTVECRKQGAGGARETVVPRYDTAAMLGNAVTSAGLGYYVDRHSGAGFAYPATLTVMLQPVRLPRATDEGAVKAPVF